MWNFPKTETINPEVRTVVACFSLTEAPAVGDVPSGPHHDRSRSHPTEIRCKKKQGLEMLDSSFVFEGGSGVWAKAGSEARGESADIN